MALCSVSAHSILGTVDYILQKHTGMNRGVEGQNRARYISIHQNFDIVMHRKFDIIENRQFDIIETFDTISHTTFD